MDEPTISRILPVINPDAAGSPAAGTQADERGPIGANPGSVDESWPQVSPAPQKSFPAGEMQPHYPRPSDPPAEPFHFSLAELLALVTMAAVLLAVLRLTGPAAFAAVSGVLAFVSLVAISMLKPDRAIIHVAWWTIVLIYLLSAAAAILQTPA
ncbi:MAG: hypothetical protein K8T25_19820 [Planctomycetia bacterium]|nr:hypothetical protein [Planctomycetia bacterium]